MKFNFKDMDIVQAYPKVYVNDSGDLYFNINGCNIVRITSDGMFTVMGPNNVFNPFGTLAFDENHGFYIKPPPPWMAI